MKNGNSDIKDRRWLHCISARVVGGRLHEWMYECVCVCVCVRAYVCASGRKREGEWGVSFIQNPVYNISENNFYRF